MKKRKIVIVSFIIALTVILTSVTVFKDKDKLEENPEILKSRSYAQVKDGDENIEGTDYVKFDAYYLRDLDGDGYAEKLRGTCRQIGAQDTLYMDLNVLTNGTLKDAKITINADNFYFATALVKDNVLSKDYVSTNTKELVLNDVPSGNQKLIFGIVQSGDYSKDSTITDAIGNDTNKYSSSNNTITLTGTHVTSDGKETQITKTIILTNDWHGTTKAELYMSDKYKNQEVDVDEAIDNENNKFNVKFDLKVYELDKQLLLYKNHIEGELPLINGYAPTNVTVLNQNVNVIYDKNTRIFSLESISQKDDNGIIKNTLSRNIEYEINVEYPLEAYTTLGENTITINVPVKTYFEGYNNPSTEFYNPYRSNIAQDVVCIVCRRPQGNVARVDVRIGKFIYGPDRYVISKELPLNRYNNIDTEDKNQDRYIVRWDAYTGTGARNVSLSLKETTNNYSDQFLDSDNNYISMERYVSNVGIYFSYPESMLGENGYINVYNDQTNELIHTFTKDDWQLYNEYKPYMYDSEIKHIRVETSNVSKSKSMSVYNVKEIDDVLLTAEYEKTDFDKLSKIYSNLTGYLKADGNYNEINSDTYFADYEESHSVAKISMESNNISNQETTKNAKINITTDDKQFNTKKWLNGEFLIKYPQEIIAVNINNVTSEDKSVTITGVDTYEDNGNIYTKIYTSNAVEKTFDIVIDADITADPRNTTTTKDLELFYYNPACHNYNSKTQDTYDVNSNGNIVEPIGYTTLSLNIIAPSNLLTSQIATEFDDNGTITIAPQDAVINKIDGEKTAKINLNIINNYSNTISEVKLVGKIPFKGNKYQLNGGDLGSTFSTTMTSDGISIPDELKEYATVYYSYNENVTEDINAKKNGWTTTPQDFTKVKTYLIYLGDYVLPVDETKTFNYTIQLPGGLKYNDISYSNYAIYYYLDTDQGKLKTQTEPNKLGFLIAEKYDLEITKYEKNSNKIIPGVVFSATDEIKGESKTSATYSNGIATLKNLYVEREYVVREIRTNDNYVLNDAETTIIGHIVNGNLEVEVLNGAFKETPVVEQIDNGNSKVKVSIENEVRYNFELNKTLQGTNEAIRGIIFELKNNKTGLSKIYTTNKDGKLKLNLLEPNVQYTLTETQSNGHYLKEPVTFIMVRDSNNNLNFNVLAGELNTLPTMDLTGEIPKVIAGLSNEKIPTYSLRITKKETDTDSVIKGAQFKLIGTDKEDNVLYTTDENGIIQIDNLYQFVEGKNITGEYTLQEVYPTEGYILNETPVVFKAQKDASGNLNLQIISGKIRENIEDVQIDSTNPNNPIINITIDNDPIFTLTKVDSITKEPLEGVEFEITDIEGNKVFDANGNAVDKLYTNHEGKIRLSLVQGLYKAVETTPLEGYVKPEQYTGIGVGESKKAEISIEVIEIYEELKNNSFRGATLIEDGVIAVGDKGIAKYDFEGKLIWSISESFDKVVTVEGGVIAVGNEIKDGEYLPLVAKYDFDGNRIWKNWGNEDEWRFDAVTAVEDGAIAVGGKVIIRVDSNGNTVWKNIDAEYNYSDIAAVEDGVVVYGYGSGHGVIAKYDLDGNIVWKNTEEVEARVITAVDDGIFAIYDKKLTKYDFGGNILWTKTNDELGYHLSYVVKKVKYGIVVAGIGSVVMYDFDGNVVCYTNETANNWFYGLVEVEDGFMTFPLIGNAAKYKFNIIDPEIPASQNVIIENNRKQYKITTDVDGVGGIISGQDDDIYEEVIHGENSQKDIVVTPNDGYKVVEITVNGEKVSYIANDDGTVELDKFVNMTSDKHIVVKFSDTVSDIIEHHYLKGTTTRVASDKVQYGNIGDKYVTSPKMNLQNYILVKLDDGDYQIPDNASGVFKKETQVVTYYYELKPLELIVHHYVDGTEDKVADDVITYGEEGNTYTTSPVTYPELNEKYELVEGKLPDNANGTYINSVTEVTYYYRVKEHKITTKVDGIGGTISGQGQNPYETVLHGENSIKDIIITPNEGYELESITINGISQDINSEALWEDYNSKEKIVKFTNVIEDKEIVVKFRPAEIEVSFIKEWDDNNNSAEKRPDEVIFEIYDGNNKLGEKTLTKTEEDTEDNNTWADSTMVSLINEKSELVNLDNLSFVEKEVNTNELQFYATDIKRVEYTPQKIEVYVTNTFNVPDSTIDITVTKNWSDNDNVNGRRPNQIKLQLKNGDTIIKEQIINVTEENTQNYTFTGLTEYDENGDEIKYTIDEIEVNENDLEFYSKEINGYIITNTFTVPEDKITIDITKKWEDNSNENNTRPSQIKLQVKNGDIVVQEKVVDVTEENEKVYKFTDIAKYGSDAQEIIYTVDEIEVQENDLIGYTKNIEEKVITNTIKQHNITTEVNGIGGTISGQNDNPYEVVNHGATSTKDIVITPNTGYKISKITINDVEQTLPDNKNEEYTLSKFTKVSEDKHVIVEFKKIEYKITTEVDGVGGTITGQESNPYEIVLYGENSIKDIVVTPSKGYKISNITINGESIEFTPNEDKTYTLSKFINMTEDKHIVATFENIETSIVVKHQTEDGTDLADPELVEGIAGQEYKTNSKEFAEYELKITPDNANGVMEEEQIEVIYVYSLVKGKVVITKVDKNDNTKYLSGATFKVEKIGDSGNVVENSMQEKTTDENGKIEFNELTTGKYRITETKAPEGYELSMDTIEVQISKEQKEISITATDRLKLELPNTGGNGMLFTTLLGINLILVAIIFKKYSLKINGK